MVDFAIARLGLGVHRDLGRPETCEGWVDLELTLTLDVSDNIT